MGGDGYYGALWLRYIRGCVLSVLVAALMIVAVGCIEEKPLRSFESPIPAHFTTYTDELGLFDISYPPDWEPAFSEFEEVEAVYKQIVMSIELDAPLESTSMVFFAGVPTDTGYNPSVNVVAESLPGVGGTLDKVVEAEIRGIRELTKEYHEFSRVRTAVGGREAIVLDWEGNQPVFGETRQLQVYVLGGEVVWCVTCATSPEQFEEFDDIFHDVVRSLRILSAE